jgi:tetratricopeptide (TPR) repeat protein
MDSPKPQQGSSPTSSTKKPPPPTPTAKQVSEALHIASSLFTEGLVKLKSGAFTEALSLLEHSLLVNQRYLPPSKTECVRCYSNIAFVHDKLGNLQQAFEYYERAKQELSAKEPPKGERDLLSRLKRKELLKQVLQKLAGAKAKAKAEAGSAVHISTLTRLTASPPPTTTPPPLSPRPPPPPPPPPPSSPPPSPSPRTPPPPPSPFPPHTAAQAAAEAEAEASTQAAVADMEASTQAAVAEIVAEIEATELAAARTTTKAANYEEQEALGCEVAVVAKGEVEHGAAAERELADEAPDSPFPPGIRRLTQLEEGALHAVMQQAVAEAEEEVEEEVVELRAVSASALVVEAQQVAEGPVTVEAAEIAETAKAEAIESAEMKATEAEAAEAVEVCAPKLPAASGDANEAINEASSGTNLISTHARMKAKTEEQEARAADAAAEAMVQAAMAATKATTDEVDLYTDVHADSDFENDDEIGPDDSVSVAWASKLPTASGCASEASSGQASGVTFMGGVSSSSWAAWAAQAKAQAEAEVEAEAEAEAMVQAAVAETETTTQAAVAETKVSKRATCVGSRCPDVGVAFTTPTKPDYAAAAPLPMPQQSAPSANEMPAAKTLLMPQQDDDKQSLSDFLKTTWKLKILESFGKKSTAEPSAGSDGGVAGKDASVATLETTAHNTPHGGLQGPRSPGSPGSSGSPQSPRSPGSARSPRAPQTAPIWSPAATELENPAAVARGGSPALLEPSAAGREKPPRPGRQQPKLETLPIDGSTAKVLSPRPMKKEPS